MMTSDTITGPLAAAEFIRRVQDHEVDLLIGTQMIAKGLDFPNVRLVGVKSVRDGTGAKLKLRAGALVSYDQAMGGLSYCSAQDPRILFGLGPQAKVDVLEVLWPSGEQQVLRGLPINRYITVEEGKGITPGRP